MAHSIYAHLAQNVALISLSIIVLPLDTFVLLCSLIYLKLHGSEILERRESIRRDPNFKPCKILVTGVGMTKGLALARSFYRAGHDVVGADFEPHWTLVAGRMSKALCRFHTLPTFDPAAQPDIYIESLKSLILHEKILLWVSCSGVVSAVHDGFAKQVIERDTPCQAIQFDEGTTRLFHEKDSFMQYLSTNGFPVPETHKISDIQEAQNFFDRSLSEQKYIVKPVALDDANRADMTLLPLSTQNQTIAHLSKLDISENKPWILQEFVDGKEFCTQALVIRGKVIVFVACPSSDLLMHYEPLPVDSALSNAMLNFTQSIASSRGETFSGHLSFDFLIKPHTVGTQEAGNLARFKLYPIECNPRCHTAVVLLKEDGEVLANAYLSALRPELAGTIPGQEIPMPKPSGKYYWIGHDLVTCFLLPIFRLALLQSSWENSFGQIKSFLNHLAHWSDGTFESFDPWPWWWLYHFYWPMQFFNSIWYTQKWSRINVSTTKMFQC